MAQITAKDAVAEINRRLREERAWFYKPHRIQELFHRSQARIRGLFAGNRLGKTYCAAMDMHWHVSKTHPFWAPLSDGPVKGRACCVDYQTIRKSMIEDTFRLLVPRSLLRGGSWDSAWSQDNKTLTYANGGFIEFMSYEQDVEAYAGVARHVIWEDEEAPEPVHRENMARLSTTKGIMMVTLTPVRPHMWVVSEIYERADIDENIEVFTASALENPYVDPETIKMMISQINDPVEREARLTGEPTWYAGKIFPDYGDLHRVEPFTAPNDWDLVVAIDPHDTKETAVSFAYWDLSGDVYFLDELWVGGSWQKIASEIQLMCKGRRPSAILIDPSSVRDPKIHGTDSIYNKMCEVFPDLQKWASHRGSVWMGVQDVRDMLRVRPQTGRPKLFVCAKNCPMTDWQLGHYGLKPPTAADQYRYDPKPMKVKEDFCDCVRGTVMFGRPLGGYSKDRVKYMSEMHDDEFGLREYH